MEVWFLVLLLFCWLSIVYFLYTTIYNKIKLHNICTNMQRQKIIDVSVNINLVTFKSLFFWMIPVRKFLKKDNEKHNQLARKINNSLLGILILVILFCFLMVFH